MEKCMLLGTNTKCRYLRFEYCDYLDTLSGDEVSSYGWVCKKYDNKFLGTIPEPTKCRECIENLEKEWIL